MAVLPRDDGSRLPTLRYQCYGGNLDLTTLSQELEPDCLFIRSMTTGLPNTRPLEFSLLSARENVEYFGGRIDLKESYYEDKGPVMDVVLSDMKGMEPEVPVFDDAVADMYHCISACNMCQ